MNIKDYLTVTDISKKLGLTEERIRELINLGEIRATKIRKWYVHPKDVEKFVQARSNYR